LAFALSLIDLIPVRKITLIEGIFDHEERSLFNSGRIFCFRKYCRKHLEAWRETGHKPKMVSNLCQEGISWHALDISEINPKKGSTIKIIAWQTLSGKIRIYSLEPSDWVWTDPYEEELRLEASKKGYADVDTYKRDLEHQYCEKRKIELMRKHGLTTGEVETLEYMPDFITAYDTLSKRKGITAVELEKQIRERIRIRKTCDLKPFDIANEFAKTDILNEEAAEELGISVEEYREYQEKKHELMRHCFNMKERIAYARTGFISPDRMEHLGKCSDCLNLIAADRIDYHETGKIGGLTHKAWKDSKVTLF